jgi:EmrB/QacA subfamily drug resistance transporter
VSSSRTLRPRVVLAICCLSVVCVGIDNTIVNIALPTLRHDLHASFAAAQWTIDAYQIVLGALLISSGAIADRYGRRRMLQIGLSIFTLGSLACSVAPTIGWLVGLRVLQATGASMMNPVALAIVSAAYTDPNRRARAFGLWSSAYGLSMALGPSVGGFLVGAAGWRSVFWVTAPVALLCVLLTALFVGESHGQTARRLDPIGQMVLCGLLVLVALLIIDGSTLGRIIEIGMIVVLALGAVFFLWWEARQQQPLIDLRFFRSPPFSAAVVIALIGTACSGGYLWVMTFYLQSSRGLSPAAAGLFLAVGALVVVLVAPVSGALAAHSGPRLPLMVAGLGFALSGVLLTSLTGTSTDLRLLASLVAFGIGFGMLNAPVTNVALSGMPASRSGVAAAIASTGRQVGQALGVAVIGALVTHALVGDVAVKLPAATHAGWWVIVAGGILVAAMAWLGTTKGALAAAARVRYERRAGANVIRASVDVAQDAKVGAEAPHRS